MGKCAGTVNSYTTTVKHTINQEDTQEAVQEDTQ